MLVWQNGGLMEPLLTIRTCIAILVDVSVRVEVWLPQNPDIKN